MFGIHDFGLFVVSGLLLNITPGPDLAYIALRAGSQGFRAGAAAALGIGAGCFVHILAATVGLSALLLSSALAFTFVKWIGAAYLLYLGLSLLRSKPAASVAEGATAVPELPLGRIFREGFLTNATNPKVALFFLAFLPQFITPGAPDAAWGVLLLGLVFDFNATLWDLLVAAAVARVGRQMRQREVGRMLGVWLKRMVGGLFVVVGIKLALARQP